ncbi:MAG: DUF4340 domain-containing protein [Phycisphaeraceae bacterium]
MNFKTTLVLLVLLAGVGAFFLFYEWGRVTGPDETTQVSEDGQPLLGEDAPAGDDVRQVAVRRDAERVVLFREQAGWWQVEPVRFAVQAASAEGIVAQAVGLRWRQRFEPGAEANDGSGGQPTLEDVGLASPRAEVTLTAGDRAWTVQLGRRTLDGQGYVMLEGDEHVYIVGDGLHQAVLDETIRDWRRRTLAGPRAAEADRVTIEQGEQTIELAKQDGRWHLDAEHRERAGQAAVEALVNGVRSMSIASFVADAPDRLSAYGLHEPVTTVTIRTPALGDAVPGRSYALRIGASADMQSQQHYATWSVDEQMSPVVFTVEQQHVDRLAVTRDELRDPGMVTTPADEVSALHVAREGQPALHLVRDPDQGYRFADDGPGYRVDYNTASEVVEAIAAAEATGYVSAFEAEGDAVGEPAAELTLTRRGGRTEQVRLFDDPGADPGAEAADEPATYLAVREDEPVAYRVPGEALELLFAPRLAFRDMELLNVPSAEVTGVTLQRDDGHEFVFTRDDDTWRLEGHNTFERRAFEGLLGSLRPLRAASWSDQLLELGAGEGWLLLTVEAPYVDAGEPSRRTLHVNVARGLAMLDGVDQTFELPATFVERLRAEYRPRTVLSMPTSEIAEIRRVRGDETLTLRRTSEGEYLSDGDTAVREQPAAALFDTLSSLSVWRYVDEPDGLGDAPEREYVIERTEGEPYTLELWRPEDGGTVGRLGGRWFQFDGETLDVLYDTLLEEEEPVTFEVVEEDVPARSVVDPVK